MTGEGWPPERVLRLGTRKSPMAMAQSGQVANMITAACGARVELVGLTAFGDVTNAQLDQIGGMGVFVSVLRASLLAGEVDLAVHSLKDLPTASMPGITLAAVPDRDDPRDALVAAGGAKLADLPAGARIGTGSPRRVAQLGLLRPDVECVPIRGNAGTRLGRVDSGEVDAVVLAHAGLARIGRLDLVTEVFDTDAMTPAPGQGALAVECRSGDHVLTGMLAGLDDPATRAAVTAERGVLAEMGVGCSAPVGAYATGTQVLHLVGMTVLDGAGAAIRASASGPPAEAERLGREVAVALKRGGTGTRAAASAAPASDGDETQ